MRLYRTAFRDGRLGVTEAVPGRWVPWCVAHGATQVANVLEADEDVSCPEGWDADLLNNPREAVREAAASWLAEGLTPCVWHPQGAFIPEVKEYGAH